MSTVGTPSGVGRSTCNVVDAVKGVPNEAKYISLRIAGLDIPVKNAHDILTWICKKMTLHRTKQFQTQIRARRTSWLKSDGYGMARPCKIAYNCFVDLDGSDRTALLRASLIVKWLSWPSNDAVITYERASANAGNSATLPMNKAVIPSNPSIEIAHPRNTVDSGDSKIITDATRGGMELSASTNDNVKRFSYKYDNVEAITGAKPISLIFKGKEYPLDGKWLNLPEKICMALETLWPCKLHDIVGRGNVPNMALNPTRLRKGKFVKGAGVWYEANCASREFVQQTRRLCKLFGIGLESVLITYTKPGQRQNGQDNNSSSAIAAEDVSNSKKIGVYVKQHIYAALAEDRIPDDDFVKLLTVDGTKELLGTTLSACPLFAYSPMIGSDGRGHNSWGDPAVRRGKRIFVNSQWYERHWDKAMRLLSRWENKPLQPATTRATVPSHSYESQLAELLEAEFANGIRPSSIIDRNKIRKLYRQYHGMDLPEDFDFNAVLPRVGVVHDGKVFPRPSSKGGGWRTLVERLVGQGQTVFQFSRLMERHASELMQIGIVSSEMLRETMAHEAQDAFEISGELFGPKGPEPLDKRFASLIVPQEGSIIDMVAVSKRIPYVDIVFIRNLCKGLDNLVRISQDAYVIVSRVEFDDAEVARGRSQCESAIEAEGFFSLSQLRLDDSAAMNDRGMADRALRRAFFQRFLSERFDIHGQIVCAKGASIDGQIPLHAFLRERSDVSLEQLETVAKEYNIAPWLALKTAHEEMVRVDRERFVSPALIIFDVPSIEKSISDICEGCIMPFGAFGNLADFPAVPGFAWNEFLLEAFLRRASTGFRLVSPSVPARDVSGAVVPCMNCEWSAEDAFATIALRCGVAADVEEVGDFLVATQCVLRRSTKTVGAVVSRMKELEKR